VYGQEPITPVELDVVTARTMEEPLSLEDTFLENRLGQIEDLEVEPDIALERTEKVQQQRKEKYDKKIRLEPIEKVDSVLLYDSRHQKFPGKLHISWMDLFKFLKYMTMGCYSKPQCKENYCQP
jgi:hypothetical protein